MKAAAVVALFLLSGCAASLSDPCRGLKGAPSLFARLYFGRGGLGAPVISDTAWREFLAREVTPRFPDGLTAMDGYGQWRDPDTNDVGREASSVMEIVAPDTRETLDRLDAVERAYRAHFNQKAVGQVLQRACADFGN